MMGKRDMLRWLRKRNREPQPDSPLWVRILIGLALLAFVARIAWIVVMG